MIRWSISADLSETRTSTTSVAHYWARILGGVDPSRSVPVCPLASRGASMASNHLTHVVPTELSSRDIDFHEPPALLLALTWEVTLYSVIASKSESRQLRERPGRGWHCPHRTMNCMNHWTTPWTRHSFDGIGTSEYALAAREAEAAVNAHKEWKMPVARSLG